MSPEESVKHRIGGSLRALPKGGDESYYPAFGAEYRKIVGAKRQGEAIKPVNYNLEALVV